MRTIVGLSIVVVCALSLAGCGDDGGTQCGPGTVEQDGECVPESELVCGEGTHELAGECVPYDPDDATPPVTTATPGGGAFRAIPGVVVLTTDEPATIYYTTDGTTPTTSSTSSPYNAFITDLAAGDELRFFAVDLAGNNEDVKTEVYMLDLDGPGPVTGLGAAAAGAAVTVSWTNPADADLAGVLIARGIGGDAPVSQPVPGVFYDVGDTLPGGDEVIFAGAATSAPDTIDVPGFVVYAAWAFDDLGNYSPRRFTNPVGLIAPLAGQTATLSISLAGTVTVTTQPSQLTLSGSATYDATGQTLTVTLTVNNEINRVIHNLKALTTAINEGTQAGPTFGGDPFTYYGPGALRVGGATTRTFRIDGVTGGTDPILVSLELVDHPTLLQRDDVIDSSGAVASTDTGVDSRPRQIAVDALGITAAFGAQDIPGVSLLDLRSLAASTFLLDVGAESSVGGVGFAGTMLYAAATDGGHWNGSDGQNGGQGSATSAVHLIALDLRTSEEVGRLTLAPASADSPAARGVFISPDGGRAAVLVGRPAAGSNELWFIDLDSFTIIDTDPGTVGDQPVALSNAGFVEHGTWNTAGTTFYAGFRNFSRSGGGDGVTPPPVDVVDATTFAVTQLTPANGALAAAGMTFHGGKLYYTSGDNQAGTPDAVTVFDIAGGTQAAFNPVASGGGVVFDPSGTRYYVAARNSANVAIVNAADDAVIGSLTVFSKPHGFAITPF